MFENNGWEKGMSAEEFIQQEKAKGLTVFRTKFPLFGPEREHMDANGIDRTMIITMGSATQKARIKLNDHLETDGQ